LFIGTLYMQQVLGYSPMRTGLAWLATSVTAIAAVPAAPRPETAGHRAARHL
jgi:hypothetical protein